MISVKTAYFLHSVAPMIWPWISLSDTWHRKCRVKCHLRYLPRHLTSRYICKVSYSCQKITTGTILPGNDSFPLHNQVSKLTPGKQCSSKHRRLSSLRFKYSFHQKIKSFCGFSSHILSTMLMIFSTNPKKRGKCSENVVNAPKCDSTRFGARAAAQLRFHF